MLPAALVAGIGADVAFDPVHRHVPLCPFKALTGWDCPFCGGLRAVDELVHGHLTAALHANAVVIIAGPLLVLLWCDSMRRHQAGRPARVVPKWTWLAAVVVLSAFTVVRNLPSMAALRPS